MRSKIIFLMILIVLFTVFVAQNTEPVNLRLFLWQIEQFPKIILLVVTLVLGIFIGIFISAFFGRKKIDKKSSINKEIKKEESFRSGNV